MIINIIATFVSGKPPYPIITWKDWQTAVFVPSLYILLSGSFILFTWISLRRNQQQKIEYLNQKYDELSTHSADLFLNTSDSKNAKNTSL